MGQVFHAIALLEQLGMVAIHALAAELVDARFLHDFEYSPPLS
jgi:hypothetical protein